MHLKLSQYDVGDMELKQFYKGGGHRNPSADDESSVPVSGLHFLITGTYYL